MALLLLIGESGCAPPGPTAAGAPCVWSYECEQLNTMLRGSPGYWSCPADHGRTCQGMCDSAGGAWHCPDGTPCTRDEECFMDDFTLVDACERGGCDALQTCVLIPPGVRRCIFSGCRPEVQPSPQCGAAEACLPDPEDPETLVCWGYGLLGEGEPCSDSYECGESLACNDVGLCSYVCVPDPCPTCPPDEHIQQCRARPWDCPPLCDDQMSTFGHECRNFVCAPPEI